MTRPVAHTAVDVAAFCSGALVLVSGLTGNLCLALAGLALLLTCGGLLSVISEP